MAISFKSLRALVPALGLAILVGVSGCGGAASSITGNARVRVHNSTANSTGYDLVSTATELANNLGSGASTGYTSLSVLLNTDVALLRNGTTTVLDSLDTSYDEGGRYTLLISGITGSGVFPPVLTGLTDNQATPDAGKARLRVVHVAAKKGGTTADFRVGATTAALGTVQVSGLAYRNQSGTIQVDANGTTSYKIQVTANGNSGDKWAEITPWTPVAGARYTILISDDATASARFAILVD